MKIMGNVMASLKLMVMGMATIFLVITIIYGAVNLLHRFIGEKPDKKQV